MTSPDTGVSGSLATPARETSRVTTRTLLVALGCGALLAPMLPLVLPRAAARAVAAFPGRNGLIVTPIGQVDEEGSAADLVAVSTAGLVVQLTSGPDDDASPAWSPDGRRVVFSRSVAGLPADLFILERATGDLTRLTRTPLHTEVGASWSPDGKRIVFARQLPDPTGYDMYPNSDIYVVDTRGRNERQLTDDPMREYEPSWSPDGRLIAFAYQEALTSSTSNSGVAVIRLDNSEGRVLVERDGIVQSPSWSPGGDRLAFSVWGEDVWVVNRDGSGLSNVTSGHGGFGQDGYEYGREYYAAWSPKGDWIAFTSSRPREPGEPADAVNLFKVRPDGTDLTSLIDISLELLSLGRIDWGPR